MGRFNHRAIDSGDVDIQPSEFPAGFKYESFPYPYTTLIKSIDDVEMDHLLELLH